MPGIDMKQWTRNYYRVMAELTAAQRDEHEAKVRKESALDELKRLGIENYRIPYEPCCERVQCDGEGVDGFCPNIIDKPWGHEAGLILCPDCKSAKKSAKANGAQESAAV